MFRVNLLDFGHEEGGQVQRHLLNFANQGLFENLQFYLLKSRMFLLLPIYLNAIKLGLFGAAHGWGTKRLPLP